MTATADQFTNFASATIVGGAGGAGTPLNPGDTSVLVPNGSLFPSSGPFRLLLAPGAGQEIVLCTARSGNTLTITRAQEGTTALTCPVGSALSLEITAGALANIWSVLGGVNTPNLFLPPGWDTAWKAAKANSGSSPATIAAIGDSITAGYGSSDALSKSWYALVRANLLAQSGQSLGADYWDLKYAGSTFSGPNLAATYLTQHGVVTTDYVSGYSAFNEFVRTTTTTLTPWLDFTTPYACTAIDIVYFDYTAGSPAWSYKVDSGSTVNVTTTGPGTAAGVILKKISLSGLANTTHTVHINSVGVSAGACILGFTTYAQTSAGLRFANMGWSGQGLVASGVAATDTLADTTSFPPDRLALYQGYQGTSAAPTALSGFGFPTQPDLALIGFGVNDAIGSGSATTYRDTLRRLVQSLRYGKGDACSILIIGQYWGDGTAVGATSVNSSDWTGTQYPGLQDLYEAMRKVAQEYNCGYASAHTLLGRTPFTNGWTTGASDGHPTDAGHAKLATFLEAVL